MSDIAAFLTARLDEDEAVAKNATPGTWLALDGGVQSANDETQWPVSSTESVRDREDRVHIARHDPARILREVAAKRAILTAHEQVAASDGSTGEFGCKVCHYDRGDCVQYGWGWCDTVLRLAMPYVDHSDYDESWRP